MIKILKASAGSGKTFALAQNYLALLTQRYAYRHILAVTFTNKATAEMKGRILKFLSESDLEEHRQTLADILHDYSAFAVSTIDRFFQQALKSFAREIGHVADYQIELDRQLLVNESMDRILDSLTNEQSDVLEWLKNSVSESLKEGRKVELEKELYELGGRLMNEERRRLSEEHGLEPSQAFNKEKLSALRTCCREIIASFTKDVNEKAKEVQVNGKRAQGSLAAYLRGFKVWEVIPQPGISLSKEAAGSAFMDLFESERFSWYNTAVMLRDQAFSLGLASEFFKSFDALLKEKNVLSLDESNVILKDIIAGSDAPFVYEKLGVRYENFLLDEFQDTSLIQWDNFRPLLAESNAGGHDNLVVGDVKQSIYRWRGSDWTLLAREVKGAFPNAAEKPMEDNWRSLRTIVNFNNDFFRMAAAETGLRELYADVRQNVRSDDAQDGFVRVSFCDKDEMDDKVLESVLAAREAGAKFGDIAILVRRKKTGTKVAGKLISAGIPIVSDDSLTLKSSLIIRKLMGILANHENPDDRINAFLSEREKVDFPESYHSLPDLCEELLRQLRDADPAVFDGEALYIQAFMDDLREWTDAGGSELRNYILHWNDSEKTIGSPSGSDAVRIITVHKAKGLQFPYLIFPYAEEVETYKSDWHWCHLSTEGTAFPKEAEGIYPVYLGNAAANTLFSSDLLREKQMQLVDNINIFYVALTRAEKCLHIISKEPSKSFVKDMHKTTEYSNVSQILFKFCGGSYEHVRGLMYDFSKMKRPAESTDIALKYRYCSFPVGTRLKVNADAADFFGDDGATGPAASPRRNGIALHGILSMVDTPLQLDAAVKKAILDGQLTEEEGRSAFELLSERIAGHPDWFSGKGLNECTVIDSHGNARRPDRIVVSGGKTLVIDYKFGDSNEENDAKYSRQVASYCRILREIGYGNVSGVVWYVIADHTIEVA